MELEEIKQHKKSLETEISWLISEFYNKTNLWITDVHCFVDLEFNDMGIPKYMPKTEVTIEI